MYKRIALVLILLLTFTTAGCGRQNTEPTLSPVENARNDVIDKWTTAEGELGTSRFIEDIYKEYPNDDVISNLYFYCIAKEQYGYYQSLNKDKYLDQAIEYAEKIDLDYAGELADEIHAFVDKITPSGVSQEKHDDAEKKEDKYSSLTNKEKKEICAYIESRYKYYDELNGYSGDKYSDTIMKEAAQKYGLTVSQIEIIWMNMYSY